MNWGLLDSSLLRDCDGVEGGGGGGGLDQHFMRGRPTNLFLRRTDCRSSSSLSSTSCLWMDEETQNEKRPQQLLLRQPVQVGGCSTISQCQLAVIPGDDAPMLEDYCTVLFATPSVAQPSRRRVLAEARYGKATWTKASAMLYRGYDAARRIPGSGGFRGEAPVLCRRVVLMVRTLRMLPRTAIYRSHAISL